MDNNDKNLGKFLKEQLLWCKEQDQILEKIEIKLHEMRKIAKYTLENDLTEIEIDQQNDQLNELKREVYSLESQLQSVVH